MPRPIILATFAAALCLPTALLAQDARSFEPITIIDQGSFAAGGTVIENDGTFDNNSPTSAGQTFHGDHLYAFYQVPQDPRPLPLVFWHGAFQSGRSWETTADGREGFQTVFLRRRFPVYIIDQPRRGRAGNSTVPTELKPTPNDQLFFDIFRIGQWPDYFDGVAFDTGEETLNQYFRAVTPNTGSYDAEVVSDAVSTLFDRIGGGILVTHSQAGGPGWLAAIKNDGVRGIIAYEPGSGFVFPEGEVPDAMPSAAGTLEPVAIPVADFEKLTRIPIVIYYGDNIPDEPTEAFGLDNWRVRLDMAERWVEAINRHGGDATLVHLPEIGITGNTHFPFSDINNLAIADLASEWLAQKGLD
ncbi:alpha/beta hydrolase [Acuticoccus sediminis]|uniref:alpha/beta hydrolase n=1 Tax=Acuticoccus sediminis TaxID=2184697 RepID=UPI001CFD4E1A|nr:alpha/beta fold hydrolase [Acuticoccus sediminis]